MKTNLSYTLLAAFLVSVTILPLRVHSTIIFQDNFNLEPGGTSFTSITNWNATAGNFDVIGDGFFDIYPGNGKYIDMAGSTNATIETSTSILLNPGTHQLTFNLGTNLADNSINFSVEDLTFETTLFFENIDAPADGSPPMSTIVRDFEVTASTSAQIIFEEVGLNNTGESILDNIVLSFVPEPRTYSTLLAITAFTFVCYKRRKRSTRR